MRLPALFLLPLLIAVAPQAIEAIPVQGTAAHVNLFATPHSGGLPPGFKVALTGPSGFSFFGLVGATFPGEEFLSSRGPTACHLFFSDEGEIPHGCKAGEQVDLSIDWLVDPRRTDGLAGGTATLRGKTYDTNPPLNSREGRATVEGSFRAFPVVTPSDPIGPFTVQGPFTFQGTFTFFDTDSEVPTGTEALTGRGSVTLRLVPGADGWVQVGGLSTDKGLVYDFAPVPEPATLTLVGLTAAGIGLVRWRLRSNT